MKVIKSFILDTKNIRQNGEGRRLSVLGDDDAVFSLEVKSGSNYYNFQTNLFQANRTRLDNVSISNGLFNVNVIFPSVSSGAKYDIYLTAEGNTKHTDYKEARFSDGSMDINSTEGSNSRLVQKVIYQTLDVTMTISHYSPNSTIAGSSTTTHTTTTSREKSTTTIPFTTAWTVSSTRTLSINRQPVASDIMNFLTATVGAPVDISRENTFPSVTGTGSVNGAVSNTKRLVMDQNVADIMSVGDKLTGSGVPSDSVVTVVSLNPDEDNIKELEVSDPVTIADGVTLRFSNRRNHRWEVYSTSLDVGRLAVGMKQISGGGFAAQPTIKDYVDSVIILEGEVGQQTIENNRVPGVDVRGIKPLRVRNADTKVVTTTTGSSTNPIYVTFDQQALLGFKGSTAKTFAYGELEINRLTGYDVEFSDLAVSLTEVSTTTTAAVSASTSVPVTQRAGIMDGISTVSGIGIDASVENPTVSSGAGSVTGAGTIVLSAAQTLEDGITLTFPGAGTVATITGNIKINHVGNEDVTLRFDVEKFLTMH